MLYHWQDDSFPYIFKHNVEQVGERMVSAGAPLGAIVETVCSGTIGWRSKSQKIIIFATDRNYEGLTDANVRKTKVFLEFAVIDKNF